MASVRAMSLPDYMLKKDILLHGLPEAIQKQLDFIKEIEEMEDKVAQIQGWCVTHRYAQNTAKIGLGVIGVAGGICTIIAPFTGGASLVAWGVAAGSCSIAAAAGGVTHAVASAEVNRGHQNQLISKTNEFQDAAKRYGAELARLQEGLQACPHEMYIRSGLSCAQLGIGLTELIFTKIAMYQATVPAVKTGFDLALEALPTLSRAEMFQRWVGSLPSAASSSGASSVATGSGLAATNGTANTVGSSASQGGKLVAGTGAKVFGVVGGGAAIAIAGYDIVTACIQLANQGPNEQRAISILAEMLKVRASVYDTIAKLRQSCVERLDLVAQARIRERSSRNTTIDLNALPGFSTFEKPCDLQSLPGFANFDINTDWTVHLNPDPLGGV